MTFTIVSPLSGNVLRPTVVVPTTLVRLPPKHCSAFADYLDEFELADTFIDSEILRNPPTDGVWLDAGQMAREAPDALYWLKERHCQQVLGGCRLTHYDDRVLSDLLTDDYQGQCWDALRYAVIAASALEVSIVLEMAGCPTLLQLELPEDER